MTKDEIRERLVELLKTNACPSPFMCDPTCRYYGYGDCFPDRFADYLVAHGVTFAEESEWIPVSERLPENEQDVLIAVMRKHYAKPEKYIQFVARAFHTDGKHDTEHSSYVWNDCFENFEYDEENDAYKIPEGWWESVEYGDEFQAVDDFVTHWMPLPQSPKEEK